MGVSSSQSNGSPDRNSYHSQSSGARPREITSSPSPRTTYTPPEAGASEPLPNWGSEPPSVIQSPVVGSEQPTVDPTEDIFGLYPLGDMGLWNKEPRTAETVWSINKR